MNRQDIANLTLRVVGLFALILALGMLSAMLGVVVAAVQQGDSLLAGNSWRAAIAGGVPCLLLTISGLVLLLAAPFFARRIFPTTESAADPAHMFGLHAFAYSVAGLFIGARGLGSLGVFLANLFQYEQAPSWGRIVTYVTSPCIDIVVGLLLFFGSHGLVRIWSRLRYVGLRREMNLCVRCGSSLSGNTSGICSECETPVGQPISEA